MLGESECVGLEVARDLHPEDPADGAEVSELVACAELLFVGVFEGARVASNDAVVDVDCHNNKVTVFALEKHAVVSLGALETRVSKRGAKSLIPFGATMLQLV